MRFNLRIWPDMGLIEFLWKLVATVVFIGLIGVVSASHAPTDSSLQGFSYFVVGSCSLIGLASAVLAVVLHIWKYKPQNQRQCVDQSSN